MDNKDLALVIALAKSSGGGGSGPDIPTPSSSDAGKVLKVDNDGEYELGDVLSGAFWIERISDNSWSVTYSDVALAVGAGKLIMFKDVTDDTYVCTHVNFSGSLIFLYFFDSAALGRVREIVCSEANGLVLYTQFIIPEYNMLDGGKVLKINRNATNCEWASIYNELTSTLTTGATTLTISDSIIKTNSTVEIFTDTYGVNPTDAVVTSGVIVLTFEAQQADVGVKVRVS